MKQKIKNTITTLGTSAVGWGAMASGVFAEAADYAPSTAYATLAGLPQTNAIDFALDIGRALFTLLGLVALVLIIYGGFLLLTSQGESDKVKKGRDTLLWSIIGIIVILSSLGILTYIDNILFS